MLLKISLFLAFIVYAAEANPDRPGCNLVGSSTNVMTRTTIMSATPIDATNLITFSASQYSQGDEKITVTISNLLTGGAIIHTSAGTLSSANNAQTAPTGYTAKTGCTDKMFYKQNSVDPTLTLYLTVPTDITSVNSITISVLTASGYGAVKRQAKSLTKTVTTTTSTAAPTTTTTQGPTPSPGPTTTAGPTTTTTQGPTPSPGPTTTTSAASSTTQGPTSAAASTSTSSMSTDTTTEAELDIAARATSSLVLFILPLLTLFYISC